MATNTKKMSDADLLRQFVWTMMGRETCADPTVKARDFSDATCKELAERLEKKWRTSIYPMLGRL